MQATGKFRYTKGTTVLCRTGASEWSMGKIVALNYRERDWPQGRTVPYQVQLMDGTLIFVPADVPQLCRQYTQPQWVDAVDQADMAKLKEATLQRYDADHLGRSPLLACGLRPPKDLQEYEADHLGRSPLLACVEKGWHEGALLLLSQKADPCVAAGPEKRTALHLAVSPRSVTFTDTDKDKWVFSRDEEGVSAKLEGQDSSDDNNDGEQIARISYDEASGRLTWRGADDDDDDDDVDVPSYAILTQSSREWVPARLATLVRGTAVAAEGLPRAENSAQLVRLLLDTRADVNAQDEDPDNDLDNFVSTTYQGLEQREHRSPLHYAAEYCEADVCAELLAAGAKVNLEDRFKMTPLDLAVEGGSEQVANLLLRKAADPNRGNMRRGLQQTCMHQACDLGHVKIVEFLIVHGVKVNTAGKQGMTPLHLAARKKHVEVAEVLLKSGAEVGLRDKSGHTAGHYAVTNGSTDLGKALAEGDDVQLSDRIAILESAKADLLRRQKELKEREEMLKMLHAD